MTTNINTSYEEHTAGFAASIALAEIRAAGRANVRRRLEALLNDDMLGLKGVQKVWHDAFGGTLMAVKDVRPGKHRWFGR